MRRHVEDVGARICSKALFLVLVAALLPVAASGAGTVAERNKSPAKATSKSPAVDPLSSENKFVYIPGGRRDPFTFRKADETEEVSTLPEIPAYIINPVVETQEKPKEGTTDKEKATLLVRLREKARQARAALRDRKYADAVSRCDEVLRRLEQQPIPGSGDIEEEVFRTKKTAERLKARQDAEREFKAKPLKIDAIIWREKSPVAIIEGKKLREGQMASGLIRVQRIERSFVVFTYKGVKVRRRMGEVAQEASK